MRCLAAPKSPPIYPNLGMPHVIIFLTPSLRLNNLPVSWGMLTVDRLEFRAEAERCVREAQRAASKEHCEAWMRMARGWLSLGNEHILAEALGRVADDPDAAMSLLTEAWGETPPPG
jgi:hypothetical protein